MLGGGFAQHHIGLCAGSLAAGVGSDVMKAGLLNGAGEGGPGSCLVFPLGRLALWAAFLIQSARHLLRKQL